LASSFIWKQGLATVASISALGLFVAGCGSTTNNTGANQTAAPAATAQGAPVEGGSITIDLSKNVQTFDPSKSEDLPSDEIITSTYDTLLTYKGETSDVIGNLASTWDVSADGKTYTFHLRHDVTFWNGDKMTANSFIAEVERVLQKSTGSPWENYVDPIVVGSTAYHNGQAKSVSGLKAPDPYTLVIQLTKPEPFFLQVMSMHFMSAIDPTWIKKVGDDKYGATQPMGTGAFELKSWDGQTAVLTKNTHYWKKDESGNALPYLDQVTINVNKNTQVDAMRFQLGQTAFLGSNTTGIPSTAYPQFTTSPKLKNDIITQAQGSVHYLGINVQEKPFTNPLVRQALEYAVDKQRIIQLLNGRYIVANQPLPPDAFGYVKDLPADVNYTYDVAKAKQLMQQSGISLPVKTTFYVNNDPDMIKVATAIQSDLAAIGIQASIRSMDWNTFLTDNSKGTEPLFILDWNQDFPDAYDFMNTLFTTAEMPINNSSMYSNPQVDSWLAQAATDTNSQERQDLYKKATVQIMRDATWVPIYYGKSTYAVQPWVHGFFINPNEEDQLAQIWVDKSHG